MPTYNFDCEECKKTYELFMDFKEFDALKADNFECPVCKKNKITTVMKMVFDATFVKIFLKGPDFTRNEV
jgi:putative FmdB family regulatory protein